MWKDVQHILFISESDNNMTYVTEENVLEDNLHPIKCDILFEENNG
jgi:hypothetical protein